MKNQEREGHIAAFFHGNPDAGTTVYYEFHQWPDHDRMDVTKHRDVVEFYVGNEGWEVTYRGKKPMDKELLDDFICAAATTPSRPRSRSGSRIRTRSSCTKASTWRSATWASR